MKIDNLACYECKKSESGIHYWHLMPDGKRYKCFACNLILSEEDSKDLNE